MFRFVLNFISFKLWGGHEFNRNKQQFESLWSKWNSYDSFSLHTADDVTFYQVLRIPWTVIVTNMNHVWKIQLFPLKTKIRVKKFSFSSHDVSWWCFILIMKTPLFQYIENFTTKIGKLSDEKFRYFSYFFSQIMGTCSDEYTQSMFFEQK